MTTCQQVIEGAVKNFCEARGIVDQKEKDVVYIQMRDEFFAFEDEVEELAKKELAHLQRMVEEESSRERRIDEDEEFAEAKEIDRQWKWNQQVRLRK